MKALMYVEKEKLELQDVPKPEGECIVRVTGCCICGTDMKALMHGHPSFVPPSILGHEFCGVIDKAPACSGLVPGDPVVVAPYGECGVCESCAHGAEAFCTHKRKVSSGAFCEYVSVPADFIADGVIKLPAQDDAYTLVEPLSCVLLARERLRIREGSRVLIAGGGPMGTLFALTLLDEGIMTDVSEPNESRRKMLAELGVPVFAPEALDARNYDNIVVAVNIPSLVEQYVRAIRANGTVHVFAGLSKGTDLALDAAALHYRGVTVTGTSGFTLATFRAAFALIEKNPAHYRRLITLTTDLAGAAEAFRTLAAGEALKVLIRP